MVLRWNEILCQVVRTDRTAPPMAARNMAIVHVAIYDAVNAIYRTHYMYYTDVVPAPGTSPEAAAAAAAYGTLSQLYPQQKESLDREYAASLAALPAGAGRDAGADLGLFVARKVLAWRSTDGSTAQSEYRLKKIPGLWQPTPPAFAPALLPQWGRVAPFAMRPDTRFYPPAPPALASAAYTRAFHEVLTLGGRDNSARTPEQTEIALFWADGDGTVTPVGHWNQIAQTVALSRGHTLAENARMFALLNLGLADAGTLCWLIKFHYGYWRPVTAIPEAALDGNPQTAPDPNWTPLIVTPPFPSYTSGHSTFSGAAAAVLADFCGTDQVTFSSTSGGLPGVTRQFTSFSAAAAEAGQSRIYGGIHWQFDNVEGLTCGRNLGHFVTRHYLVPTAHGRSRTVR
jgi:membrane-associated phospholipid phosphatase